MLVLSNYSYTALINTFLHAPPLFSSFREGCPFCFCYMSDTSDHFLLCLEPQAIGVHLSISTLTCGKIQSRPSIDNNPAVQVPFVSCRLLFYAFHGNMDTKYRILYYLAVLPTRAPGHTSKKARSENLHKFLIDT